MTPETETPTEYTPTTDQVRRYWQHGANAWFEGVADDRDEGPDGSIGAEFDRWLSTHDREVAARAWGEGAKAAREEDFLADDFVETPNPYRIENGETDD